MTEWGKNLTSLEEETEEDYMRAAQIDTEGARTRTEPKLIKTIS